jgi:hypothetical protein
MSGYDQYNQGYGQQQQYPQQGYGQPQHQQGGYDQGSSMVSSKVASTTTTNSKGKLTIERMFRTIFV